MKDDVVSALQYVVNSTFELTLSMPNGTQLISLKIKNGMGSMSKKEFAELMGVQPSIVTRWLSGKHNFTIKTLFEIEEKLKIKIIDL